MMGNEKRISVLFYFISFIFIVLVTLSIIFDNYPLLLAAIFIALVLIVIRIRYGPSVLYKTDKGILGMIISFRRKHPILPVFILSQVILIAIILMEVLPMDLRLMFFILGFEGIILLCSLIARAILKVESSDKPSS
jgi:hypothetical protein